MFQYTSNQSQNGSRRLTSSDRLASDGASYFHPYEGSGVPARAATSMSSVGAASGGQQSHHSSSHHARSASGDFGYNPSSNYPMMEEEVEEPMEILYEESRQHHVVVAGHGRAHSEPIGGDMPVSSSDLELQLSMAADHLLALLQREANDYSLPLPVKYYPGEFAEPGGEDAGGDGKKDAAAGKKNTIGPWRKRIASWMYDVVDHFQYDRNVVSIALRYIDQYVGHLLLEGSRGHRRADSGIGSSRGSSSGGGSNGGPGAQPIKRRHFQLIAVTSLYLAIKVHGELMEDDPVSGTEYDVVGSLIDEVDGRAFLGKPLEAGGGDTVKEEDEDTSSQESDDDLRAVSHKISDLKRRHRKGRWSMHRLSQFGLPLGHPGGGGSASSSNNAGGNDPSRVPRLPKQAHSSLPYKPRKRGMLSGPLRLHSFVELSRGLFTASDIKDTEKKILVALNYVVNPPTARRFAGEMLRLLALSYCGVVDGGSTDAGATAGAAERILGLERRGLLKKVLAAACRQIEGAASVPSLSIGCAPSVLAYGAVWNAVEEEFERIAAAAVDGKDVAGGMEMQKGVGSPQLEDFQRHYRRYSRNQSPSTSSSAAPPSDLESDKELFLEAWKEQFLVTVFHATNCFLSPDSQEILRVREMLLDQVADGEGAAAAGSESSTTSPTEKKLAEGAKKRSPRSPRSVVVAGSNPRMLRGTGGSFFSRQNSAASSSGARLLSPYDSRGRAISAASVCSAGNAGRSAVSFRSLSSSADASRHRSYYTQASEPIAEAAAPASGRFARAQTPDVSHFRNQAPTRQASANYEGSWRSTGEAFQPPNPNPPFFSA